MMDDKIGLQYLRARWYDPSIGRFIGEDSVTGQVDNPLSQNRFTYVSNNPLTFVDPSGHLQDSDLWTLSPENYMKVIGHTRTYEKADRGEFEGSVTVCNSYGCSDIDANTYWKGESHRLAEQVRQENFEQITNRVQQDLIENIARYEQENALADLVLSLLESGLSTNLTAALTGKYRNVGGHHIHAKTGFGGHATYDSNDGFSISQEFMSSRGWDHQVVTRGIVIEEKCSTIAH